MKPLHASRRRLPRLLAAACACGSVALDAAAQPAVLPEVVVSATRVEDESFDLPVSIDRVDAAVIREGRPQVNLSESLNRVPGVVVQNRHNYAQDLQVSTRGFGSRSTFGVRGVRLMADGIPATMPDGQGQAATFSLGSAERIEVLRGPFSSLYGNASGGVIQIFTADAPAIPTLHADAYAGSYGTYKAGLRFGAAQEALNATGDLSRFRTGGYREHSRARRDHLNARLKHDAGERGVVTVVLNALDQPQTQDPLGLTASQVAQNRRQAGTNAVAFNARKSVAQAQAGVTWSLAPSAADRLEARAYFGDRQVTQHLAIPLAAQLATPTHSGGVIDLDRGYGGAGLRWTRTADTARGPLTASIGVDYDRMAERRRGFINDSGTTGALRRDEDNTVANADFYVQADWRFGERWTALAGLRHSRVRFESRDDYIAPGNPDDSGLARFTRTTPAAGLSYRLAPEMSLYGNLGEGFETPTFVELAYRPDGGSGLNFALRPARSLHREIGVKARPGEAVRLNVALFRVDVRDEIVVNSNVGGRATFRNASRTRREGLEVAWDARLPRGFEAAAAWTRLDARFTQPFTTLVGTPPVATAVPAGSRLPGVPARVLHAELTWRHAPAGFHAGVEARHSGNIYVNDPNTEAAPAYTVWSVRAGFEQRGRNWRVSEFVRVENVADRHYTGSVIVSEANGRYYEPAPGRNWLAGVQAELRF